MEAVTGQPPSWLTFECLTTVRGEVRQVDWWDAGVRVAGVDNKDTDSMFEERVWERAKFKYTPAHSTDILNVKPQKSYISNTLPHYHTDGRNNQSTLRQLRGRCAVLLRASKPMIRQLKARTDDHFVTTSGGAAAIKADF
eukprot:3329091-Rhodomonas_salina.1